VFDVVRAMLNHPGLSVVILSWIITGIQSMVCKDDSYFLAFVLTVLWGLYHVVIGTGR